MMRNFGLWASNGPPQDIDTMLNLVKDGAYTVLHEGHGAEQARKIIAGHASAQILVRHHCPDWPATDPARWAQEVAGRMARDYAGITARLVGANEPNLEPEPNFTEENYRAFGRWYRAFAAEVRVVGARGNVPLQIHFPAWAAGHSEDQNDLGFVGYLLPEVVGAIQLCDVVNCHCYWDVNEGPLREMGNYGGGLRYRHVARLLRANGIVGAHGNVPLLWIDEAGPWAEPWRVEQTAAHSDAVRKDRLLGCTYFLWADPTNNPGNTINQWHGRIPGDKLNWLTGEWDRLAALPEEPVTPEPVVTVPVSMTAALPVSPTGVVDVVDSLPQHPTLRYDTRSLSAISRIVIHHSAAPGDRSPEAIARYHIQADPARKKEAWAGIGYHYYITADGKAYQTQRLTTVSAHVLGKNESAVGICFAGDFTETTPTPAQVAAGRALLKQLLGDLNLKMDAVAPHKEVNPGRTECPGSDWWKTLLPEGEAVPASRPPVSVGIQPAWPRDEVVREAAWNRLYPQGVPFNPASAFFRAARARQLGVPVTGEFDLAGEFRAQGYLGGILVARIGDWDNMTLVDWLGQDGEGFARDVPGGPEGTASPPKRRRRARWYLP